MTTKQEDCGCGYHDCIEDGDWGSGHCGLGFYCCKECPSLKEPEEDETSEENL